jgi:hypothetical protein
VLPCVTGVVFAGHRAMEYRPGISHGGAFGTFVRPRDGRPAGRARAVGGGDRAESHSLSPVVPSSMSKRIRWISLCHRVSLNRG